MPGPSGLGEDTFARSQAHANSERLDGLDHKTSGIEVVSDGPGLTDAPADEAGIAIFAEDSLVGDGLLNGTRRFEEADVAGYSWLTSVGLGATVEAVIIRIEGTKGPLDYYLQTGDTPNQIQPADKVLSGDVWDYYYVGGQSNERITIKKRAETTHTRFHDELGGRAIEQVEGLIDSHQPDPSVTIDPPVWGLDTSARTFLATLHDIHPTPALAAVDKIRLDLAGSVFITHDWTVLTGPRVVAFPVPAGTDVSNITANVRVGGTVRGALTFHATAGGAVSSANEVFRLSVNLSVVAPEDVPPIGGHSTQVDHPRFFHANASLSPDPDDGSLFHCNFEPNEDGLTPVANSLFTFLWNNPPGRTINRYTMAPRGTPSADAAPVSLVDRESGGALNDTGDLTQGVTYLARFTGPSVVILTRIRPQAVIEDDPANPIEAAEETKDLVLSRAGRFYKAKPIHFADPTATYRDFATSDLPTGFTWGGAVQVSPAAGGQPDNRVIYSIPGGHFLRKITGGGSSWWVAYTPPNWRGQVADKSAADRTVRGVGDVVFFGGKVQVAATYNARTANLWHWVPMEKRRFETDLGATSPVVLPEGTHTVHVVLSSSDAGGANNRWTTDILVSDLAAATLDFYIDSHNPNAAAEGSIDANQAIFSASYAEATRTLTFAESGSANIDIATVKAIGEA